VAIARALVNNPHVILAAKPTGNLDSATGEEIMQVLEALNAAGKTIIMVTHEPDIAVRAHRTLRMKDGPARRAHAVRRTDLVCTVCVFPNNRRCNDRKVQCWMRDLAQRELQGFRSLNRNGTNAGISTRGD